ncbi:MAG TPA: hypothetical protein VMT15_06315 [Bryobacteraceae bacterium]|nr:hypothetical protein [Bryobacteraceae bacterium]
MTATESAVSREHLRTFHLSGRGLPSLRPAAPLRPALSEEILAALPSTDSAEPLPALYASCLTAERASQRARFQLALRQSVAHLQDLLAIDDAKRAPASAEKTAASLGANAHKFLAVPQLIGAFPKPPHSLMERERRARCQFALAILEEALAEPHPALWVFSTEAEDCPAGGKAIACADPCAEALAFCDRQLAEIVPVLRAMRVALLEASSSYDASIHDEMLERFDWQTADPGEIAALPAIVVLETPEHLAQNSLTSFSRLLRSGRPVQILVRATGLYIEDLSGSVADFGALALAHRGPYVLQSSLAVRDHLLHGLAQMVRTLRPAVAIVNVAPSFEAALLSCSKAFPLFYYDPDREGGWWKRFSLVEPDPLFASLTPLDALILSLRFRDQCRILPADAPQEDQIELHEYLRLYTTAPPLLVPFLNVIDDAGHTHRLAVTRELVHICFDRSRAWDMLAALATPPAETQPVGMEPAAEASIREEATKLAYQQVLALLADPQALAN